MLNAITTKLELDIMQANELLESIQLATENACAALVVHPTLSAQAIIMRGQRYGQFKILTPVDWPQGSVFGFNKLRGLTQDNMQTDGFEIMLTPEKAKQETINEAAIIHRFIKDHLGPEKEIRYVLGTIVRTWSNIVSICQALQQVPSATLLRTDHHLKAQVSKAGTKAQCEAMDGIRKQIATPLKISGNIESLQGLAECLGKVESKSALGDTGATRFAVSLQQAKAIVLELQQNPERFSQLLAASEPPEPAKE